MSQSGGVPASGNAEVPTTDVAGTREQTRDDARPRSRHHYPGAVSCPVAAPGGGLVRSVAERGIVRRSPLGFGHLEIDRRRGEAVGGGLLEDFETWQSLERH